MAGAAVLRRLASSRFLDSFGSAAVAKALNGGYLKPTAGMAVAKGFCGGDLRATGAMATYNSRFFSAKATLPLPVPKAAAKGFSQAELNLTGPEATFLRRCYSAKTTLPVPVPKLKLLFQVNGKVLPSMEAGSPSLYQMTVVADSEEEALKSMQKFVALVRDNDPVQLAAFLTSEAVTLSELKEQVSEHCIDVKSGVDALSIACLAGQQEVKQDVLCIKETVKRIEADAKKFTLLKFIGYASLISIIQGAVAGGVGWQYIKPYVEFIKPYLPEPPTDESCRHPFVFSQRRF